MAVIYDAGNFRSQILTRHNPIDKTVFQQKFACLKSFGHFEVDRRLYDTRTSETDERGNVTTYEYDTAGQRSKVIDALLNETSFSYDDNGVSANKPASSR